MNHPDLDALWPFLGQDVMVTYRWRDQSGSTLTEKLQLRYADEVKIETRDVAHTPLILTWAQIDSISLTAH